MEGRTTSYIEIFDDMLINPYQPNVMHSLVAFALSRKDLCMNPVSRETSTVFPT